MVGEFTPPCTRFFRSLLMRNFRRDRYIISEETLAYGQAYLAASQDSQNLSGIADARFDLGFCHLWRGDWDAAADHLRAALSEAERTGGARVQTLCLTYLTCLDRKRGEVEAVRGYISRSLEAAGAGQMPTYIGTAKANMAWLAWRGGDLAEAAVNGRSALELWQESFISYPLQWLALWPLIGVALAHGELAEAIGYARRLLEPAQQPPPDALAAPLEAAIQAWEQNAPEKARTVLHQAVELAGGMGYL